MGLISKDDLIDLCHIMADKCDGLGVSIWNQFATTVEWCVEVDAVEVVRCKDCIMESTCQHTQYLGEDGYCSHGERGEENE